MTNWIVEIYENYNELKIAVESIDETKIINITPIMKDNRQQYILSIGLKSIDGGTP